MPNAYQLLSFLIIANLNLHASDTLPVRIAASLDKWNKSYPTEKVFLHTDKSSYLAGETVWYKAYVTIENELSYLSKIVYVDIVDEGGKVVDKQMRPLVNGTASGDITIPRSLLTGNYSINAYTLWMLNFEAFIFRKNIRIYNYDYKPATVSSKATNNLNLHFFPEGGELVDGVKSTVAFYATNHRGLPAEIKGTITDEAGTQITSFGSTYNGYGKVEITPVAGKAMVAKVLINGVEKKFPLPAAKKEGVVLTVNNSNPNRAFVQVSRNVSNPATYNNLWVVAQMLGKPIFVGMVNFNEDATGMSIQKKPFPPGIMHITVFDAAGTPLAERLAFVNNQNVTDFSIATDSLSLSPRGKNKLSFDVSAFTQPSISVAITDAELSGGKDQENNILSNLLLTSDLKGYIHNPAYFLKNKNPEVTDHLDLLMLTHGWRRFKWEDLMSGKEVALKYPVESGISIGGKVTVPQSTKTLSGGHVDIVTKGEDSTTILSKAIVNEKGEFFVNDLSFKQMATVYLQGTKKDAKNALVDVLVDKSYIDTLRYTRYTPTVDLDSVTNSAASNKLQALISQETERNKTGSTLAGVTISTKKVSRIDSLNNNYSSDMFRMGQNLEITSSHYISIWQFLREQVSGLVVEGNLTNPNVYFSRFAGTRIGAPQLEEEGTNLLGAMETNGITYYLNEINVSDDVINTIHPSDVALIKVFKGPEGAALGMNEGGIAIYTKKGLPSKTRTGEKGFFTEKKIGYAPTREFFNPDYSVPFDTAVTDNRTTLYWKGNVKPDQTGKVTLRFFNNDITKKLKVVIQGIDKKGAIILKEQIIE